MQLCLDGYYDNMIFHRILSDFLVQTGMTTDGKTLSSSGGAVGNGDNAASIDRYLRSSSAAVSGGISTTNFGVGGGGDTLGLDRKKLEVNPRIRFNHRGQVAMAFPLEENIDAHSDDDEIAMLRYQFFITLDEAPFLDAKHVLFGSVTGSTMFNALRIGRTDADEKSGIPMDILDNPPRIKSVRVNYHPFDDLVVTSDDKIPWKEKTRDGGGEGKHQSAMEIRRKKRKGKRDFNVLSFGDEEREYEEEHTNNAEEKNVNETKKSVAMLSSHDVLSTNGNSRFQDSVVNNTAQKIDSRNSKRDLGIKEERNENDSIGRREMKGSESKHLSNEVSPRLGTNAALDKSISNREQKKSEATNSGVISAVEARRAKYLKSGSGSMANKKERLKREGDTMAKLSAFKSKVIERTKGRDTDEVEATKSPADNALASRMAVRAKKTKELEALRKEDEDAFKALPGYYGQVADEDKNENDDKNSWMGTKFKCRQHMDNDSRMSAMDKIDEDRIGGDGRRMDDYVVLDDKMRRQGVRQNEESQQQHARHH